MSKLTGYGPTGLANPKFVRRRSSDGFWWSTSTPGFETYNSASITNYGLPGVETGATGVYTTTDPGATTDGDFLLIDAAGANLTVSDVANNAVWQDRVHVSVMENDYAEDGFAKADLQAIGGFDGLDGLPNLVQAFAAFFNVATPVATTGMLNQLWRRFFKKIDHDEGAGTIKTYADDGVTVLTTQAVTTTGDTTTVGAAF